MKESFYICDNCGQLKTQTELLKECSNGGSGECGCLYFQYEIKRIRGDWLLDCETNRVVKPYSEISEEIYNILKDINNDVERVRLFKDWRRAYVTSRN